MIAHQPVGAGKEVDVVADRGHGRQADGIRHPPDQGAYFLGGFQGIDAVDDNLTAVGYVQGGEHAHGGGLAGAVGTDETDGLAGEEFEGNIIHRANGAEVAHQLTDLQYGRVHG